MARSDKHVFTYAEIRRRFNACKEHTLGEIDTSDVFGRSGGKNKGIAGAVVEQSVLGYPADSAQEPDLEIDGIDVELKVTGLKKTSKRGFVAKEPMSITAVSIDSIWQEEFYTSTLWHKLANLLVLYYLYEPKVAVEYEPGEAEWKTVKTPTSSYANFVVKGWNLHEWDEDDRRILESDWTLVRDYVRRVMLEHDSEDERKKLWPLISTNLNPQMMYLGTAPKYPNPPRFRLKNSVVTTMWQIANKKKYERLPDEPTTYAELDQRCHALAGEHGGKTVEQLAKDLGYSGSLESKSVSESLVVRMFGGKSKKMQKVEVFAKAGILCRTIVMTSREQRTEDMKLFRIDLEEIQNANVEWDESSFRTDFAELQLLCPILQEPYDDAPFAANVFLGFKRLAFPDMFVDDSVYATWTRMRELVFNDELKDVVVYNREGNPIINSNGTIRRAPNWPKSKDYIVFVRGTGRDSSDKVEVVNGIRMYRQYTWLRGKWVVERLSHREYL